MFKRIKVIFASTALALASILSVSVAPVAATTCSDHSITIYEDGNGGGDSITFCSSVTNLQNVTHTQAGYCATSSLRINDTWNDCAGSFRINSVASGCQARVYVNANYGGLMWYGYGDSEGLYNLTGSYSDAMSSIHLWCGL